MRAWKRAVSRGFTLIELMVVVMIIAVLAAMIVPALNKAQSQALVRSCCSKARSIAMSIKTYSLNWGGWTNPEAEFYTVLAHPEVPLPDPNDPSPPPVIPQQTNEFRCNGDESPTSTANGFPTSYQVRGAFVGGNLMNDLTLGETVVVSEIERNHGVYNPAQQAEADVRVTVYGDMRVGAFLPKGVQVATARIQYNPGQQGGFGEIEVIDQGDVNVALHKAVTSTCGQWDANWAPSGATDGITRSGAPYGCHNGNGHSGVAAGCRWDVELGEVNFTEIKEVHTWPRSDGTFNQINGAMIQLLDADGTVLWEDTISMSARQAYVYIPELQ